MKFSIKTNGHNGIIDITPQVVKEVKKSGVKDGICLIFCAVSSFLFRFNVE